MLDPKAFKAYDVRGVYGTELDEDGAYRVGRAYVEQFEPRTVAVGRDMRVSAPTMAAAVMEGAADGGADVLDLGMIGTEMLYFAVGDGGLDGGICVTASHNPKQYTGMKIVRRGALPVGGESGLLDVRDRALGEFRAGRAPWLDPRRGRLARIRRQGALARRRLARSGRCAWSSTRRTAWRARCCRRCSTGCRSTSSAASSSRTARFRTTSRTRCCPRTAS